jgi:hypothetical protein
LCGDAPRTCQYAEARIEGHRVVLPVQAGAAMPTRVRYCWAGSPVCTLFDSNGLPAGPFEIRVSGTTGAHATPDSASSLRMRLLGSGNTAIGAERAVWPAQRDGPPGPAALAVRSTTTVKSTSYN